MLLNDASHGSMASLPPRAEPNLVPSLAKLTGSSFLPFFLPSLPPSFFPSFPPSFLPSLLPQTVTTCTVFQAQCRVMGTQLNKDTVPDPQEL